MKNLLLIMGIGILPGCAIIDAYLMTKYDPNEYLLITQIRADAVSYKKQCDNHTLAATNAVNISNKTELFAVYSEQIPNNENGVKASKSLNEIAQGLEKAYLDPKGQPSAMFCKLKYSSIENSATVIQHVVGNRPR